MKIFTIILPDDDSGQIMITTPNNDKYTTYKVSDALNFIRREAAYYTAPTSTIWTERNK